MTRVEWTGKAVDDLDRVYRFLLDVNRRAAHGVLTTLSQAPVRLTERPRLGVRLGEFGDREVRKIIVGNYELRYEVTAEAIVVLRIWHGREDR